MIRETGLTPDRLRPARVIGFATPRNTPLPCARLRGRILCRYGRPRLIVMVMAGPDEFGIAAREYAHMALDSNG